MLMVGRCAVYVVCMVCIGGGSNAIRYCEGNVNFFLWFMVVFVHRVTVSEHGRGNGSMVCDGDSFV